MKGSETLLKENRIITEEEIAMENKIIKDIVSNYGNCFQKEKLTELTNYVYKIMTNKFDHILIEQLNVRIYEIIIFFIKTKFIR